MVAMTSCAATAARARVPGLGGGTSDGSAAACGSRSTVAFSGMSQYYPAVPGAQNTRPGSSEDAGPQRLMGLDVGSKTIGIAVSDPLGITAQGLETIRRTNKRNDLAQLGKLIRAYNVSELVVGYPLRLSGEAGAQAEKVAAFAEQLRARFSLPLHLWDE